MMDILINEPEGFPHAAMGRLRSIGAVYSGGEAHPVDSIEAVFIRLRDKIDQSFHRRYPNLRYVVSPTTGLNHIDVDYLESSGISVISLKGRNDFLENIHATAEHTLALTLSLLRRVPQACASVMKGEWNRYPFKGTELHGKSVLLVGYGRVGRQVAVLFGAFGCNVRAYDIDIQRVPPAMRVPLAEGLAIADVVSIHVNLDKSTEGFLSGKVLRQLKKGAIVINTSRGELIDQPALLELLRDGSLAGAALDVLVGEPTPISSDVHSALMAESGRLIITPHIGGFTFESLAAVESYVVELLLAEIRGHGAT